MTLSKHQGSSMSPMPIGSLQALPSSHYITSLRSGLTLFSASQSLHPTHWGCKFVLIGTLHSISVLQPMSLCLGHSWNAPPSSIEKVMILCGISGHFNTSFISVFNSLNSLLLNSDSNLCKDFPFPLLSIYLTSPHHLTAPSSMEIFKIFLCSLSFTFPCLRIDYHYPLSLLSHLGLEKVWPRHFSS